MKKISKLALLTLMFVFIFYAVGVIAAVRYVSPSGNDSTGDGSSGSPYKTITKALQIANSGDTISIGAGTYAEAVVININNIALVGADSSLTIIDPPGTDDGITAFGKTNLTIKNIQVTGSYNGFNIVNSDSITISNCYSKQNVRGIYVDGSRGNIINGNSVYNNSDVGIFLTGSIGNSVNYNICDSNASIGIYIADASNSTTVKGNICSRTAGSGIWVNSSETCIVTENKCYNNDNYGFGAITNGAIFKNNLSYNNKIGGFSLGGANNFILQNTADSTGKSISITWGSGANNKIIRNNFLPNPYSSIQIDAAAQIDLTDNYWGTTDSAVIYNKISQSQIANVILSPYSLNIVDTSIGADTIAPNTTTITSVDTSISGQITINWTASNYTGVLGGDGLAGYHIFRAKSTELTNGDTPDWHAKLYAVTGHSTTSYADSAVTVGETYYYRVTAFDSHQTNGVPFVNESWFSNIRSVALIAPAPAPDTIVIPVLSDTHYWFVNDASATGDRYTSAIGNDANSGSTANAPFRTITKALQMANPGDIIYIDAGTYTETIAIKLNGINIIGADSEITILQHSDTAANLVTASNIDSIIIKNLKVSGGLSGIYFLNVKSSLIENIQISGAQENGIYFDSSPNNTINRSVAEGMKTGFYFANGCDTLVLTGCITINNSDYGYYISKSELVNMTACQSLNDSAGVYKDASRYFTVDNCVFDGNKKIGLYCYGDLYAGVSFASYVIKNSFFLNQSDTAAYFVGPTAYVYYNKFRNINGTCVSNAGYGLGYSLNASNLTVYGNDFDSVAKNHYAVKHTTYGASVGAGMWAYSFLSSYNNNFNCDSAVYTIGYPSAQNNYWGTTDKSLIANKINYYHSSSYIPYRFTTFDTTVGVDTTPPSTVSITNLDTSTPGQIKVNFTAATSGALGGEGLAGYHIFRAVSGELTNGDTPNWYAKMIGTAGPNETSYIDANISGNDTYYYCVTAFDSHITDNITYYNESWFSDIVSKFVPITFGGHTVTINPASGISSTTGSTKYAKDTNMTVTVTPVQYSDTTQIDKVVVWGDITVNTYTTNVLRSTFDNIILTSNSGVKRIYVTYYAGTEKSADISASVTLDLTAPEISAFNINGKDVLNGATVYTNDTLLTIAVTAADSPGGAGLKSIFVSSDLSADTSYASSINTTASVSSGEGLKTVTVIVADSVTNSRTYTANVYLDKTSPSLMNYGLTFYQPSTTDSIYVLVGAVDAVNIDTSTGACTAYLDFSIDNAKDTTVVLDYSTATEKFSKYISAIALTNDQICTVTVYGKDLSGNIGTLSYTIRLINFGGHTIAANPAAGSAVTLGSNKLVNTQNINISITNPVSYSDTTQIDKAVVWGDVTVNTITVNPLNSTLTNIMLTDGDGLKNIYLTYFAGQIKSADAVTTLFLDKISPLVSILAETTTQAATTVVSIAATDSTAIGTISIKVTNIVTNDSTNYSVSIGGSSAIENIQQEVSLYKGVNKIHITVSDRLENSAAVIEQIIVRSDMVKNFTEIPYDTYIATTAETITPENLVAETLSDATIKWKSVLLGLSDTRTAQPLAFGFQNLSNTTVYVLIQKPSDTMTNRVRTANTILTNSDAADTYMRYMVDLSAIIFDGTKYSSDTLIRVTIDQRNIRNDSYLWENRNLLAWVYVDDNGIISNNQTDRIPAVVNGVFQDTIVLPHLSIWMLAPVAGAPVAQNLNDVIVFPNPFVPNDGNPQTGSELVGAANAFSIGGIHIKGLTDGCSIEIFDILGRKISSLTNINNGSGMAIWDGRNDKGRNVGSGVYFIVVKGNGQRVVKKVAIVR